MKARSLAHLLFPTVATTIVFLVHAAYIIITTGNVRVIIAVLVEDCMSLTGESVLEEYGYEAFGVKCRPSKVLQPLPYRRPEL